MLPLGRKNARRCSECDITCHANCAHLVPDFCGMSMETANMLLRDWKDINRARGGRVATQRQHTHSYSSPSQSYPSPMQESQMDHLGGDMGRLKLTGAEPPVPPKTPEFNYARPAQQSPQKDMRPTDHVMPSQMQQSASSYPPGTPASAPRPLPSGPAGRPAFPSEPIQPAAHQGRATPTYEQQDPYPHQASLYGLS